MNYTSIVFLYFFLPAFFGLFAVIRPKQRNWVMLLGSLAVIAWGSVKGLIPFGVCALAAYLCGLGCGNKKLKKSVRRAILAADLILDITGIVLLLTLSSIYAHPLTAIGAGIYTLHSAAYCFDVYRNECEAERSPVRIAAYIAFLPSLCGIPLVKPKETLETMKAPAIRSDRLADGIVLLLFGIAEKLILGDRLTALFKEMIETTRGDMSMLMAWIGAFIFGAGLFCKLKGYSHIAQGFALMMGFETAPNFEHPYSASTLREYLSSYNTSAYGFIQRYVFRPLAGEDTEQARTLIASAVSIVVICISYNISLPFLIWGVGAALLITFEMLLDQYLSKIPKPVRFIMTHMATLIGWALVSQQTTVGSVEYVSHLFTGALTLDSAPLLYFLSSAAPLVVLLALSESKLLKRLSIKLDARRVSPVAMIKPVLTFALLVLCTVFLMSGTAPHGIIEEVQIGA